MNTNILDQVRAALVALLAAISPTNAPVKTPETTLTNLIDGGRIEFLLSTNTNVLIYPTTNWISDDTIKLLVTSGQVCRVHGHVWQDGCGLLGCLVMHYGKQRYCPLCGKTETQQPGDWR